ncbi:MAG: CDP-diacylglycerol--glycerol-3-phosphate 3-phosphatidyltransferase [Luminiphilus sp.]|nr:CDP-diacylglycerol--glycerol-3-phosphate 3-phosphatidyltransferase [Luminiphilus sp.]MDG1508135.1 CDP-diacylglycerol--glycerol-3-phosphate 3-phosphatidyltransferase [Luminiphilus sp.]MDG1653992.1 CDP-diacylglycerol--glycerol-3-phosphate 3-phosphatidyltransferase [Luminiphilus sp.]
MNWNLPNILTLTRVLCIPLLVAVFYFAGPFAGPAAAVIFVLAAITDWLDGWLARLLKQESEFGAFLDPVADKLIVATALVLLVDHYDSIWLTLSAIVIIGREILVSALREWMARRGQSQSVAVTLMGKLKTTLQMIAIILLLWRMGEPYSDYLLQLGLGSLAVAVVLTLWSMWNYLRAMLSAPDARDDERA